MIIVDTEIAKRIAEDRPIQVAVIGAGYSAMHIVSQIVSSFPGIHLAVIVNRTLSSAEKIFRQAGINDIRTIKSSAELEDAIKLRRHCVTDDAAVALGADSIDAVIETTGEVEYGAWASLASIKAGKHTFALNCEMDATVGPLLKHVADKQGVIYSNSDGDEPGVASNLARHVRTMGLEVVGAGNLKGFYDVHRTPETQKAFAEANNQKPHMMTSFVDGTKLSMELTVTGNALGFGVAKRGMHGPACDDVRTCLQHFPKDAFQAGKGIVDFLLGASPYTGAFIVGHTEHPMKMDYLRYLKMGDGPFYVFYTPFHLPQLEIPITVSRGVLCHDAAVAPKGKPFCEAVAIAKKDLSEGDTLDGIGGFTNYALIDNFETSLKDNLLPMGVAQNCKVKRKVPKDTALTYDDIELPSGRQIDLLRTEMIETFFS
ncbi:NAD(P)H-dependent oxidoreductase [Marinobacter caseinilyticus]|uniref:NAD(P)H-dependent oxidoreductase n=1 Tax=Marinobacter caseinilyticus TaxID=2692195 RepID=UPI00140893E8|nr:NAD(P)-dependent oxidoreductase [Marinobacter caseinilyticus]